MLAVNRIIKCCNKSTVIRALTHLRIYAKGFDNYSKKAGGDKFIRVCLFYIYTNQVLLLSINHYSDVIMVTSQITSLIIVYSTGHSGTDQRKTSKLHVTGLCAGNSPVTGEFPTQMASNAENASIWWRHHGNLWIGFAPTEPYVTKTGSTQQVLHIWAQFYEFVLSTHSGAFA